MTNRKINGIDGDLILLGGLALGGYLLYTKLFPPPPSQEDNNTVNNIFTTPGSNNPLSYEFKYGLYAQDPSYYNAAYWNKLGQLIAQAQQFGTSMADIGGAANYIIWGEQIRSAFGVFTINFNTIQSVIQAVNSQADVSNIAAYLWFTRNIDLYQLLLNAQGSPVTLTGGLNVTQMAQIINEVNALPLSN